jgi:hypothetical protein
MSGPKYSVQPYVKKRCQEIAAMSFPEYIQYLEFAYLEAFTKGREIRAYKLENLKKKWQEEYENPQRKESSCTQTKKYKQSNNGHPDS